MDKRSSLNTDTNLANRVCNKKKKSRKQVLLTYFAPGQASPDEDCEDGSCEEAALPDKRRGRRVVRKAGPRGGRQQARRKMGHRMYLGEDVRCASATPLTQLIRLLSYTHRYKQPFVCFTGHEAEGLPRFMALVPSVGLAAHGYVGRHWRWCKLRVPRHEVSVFGQAQAWVDER